MFFSFSFFLFSFQPHLFPFRKAFSGLHAPGYPSNTLATTFFPVKMSPMSRGFGAAATLGTTCAAKAFCFCGRRGVVAAAPWVALLWALTTGAHGADPTLNTTVLTPAYFSSFHLSTWSVDIGDVSKKISKQHATTFQILCSIASSSASNAFACCTEYPPTHPHPSWRLEPHAHGIDGVETLRHIQMNLRVPALAGLDAQSHRGRGIGDRWVRSTAASSTRGGPSPDSCGRTPIAR